MSPFWGTLEKIETTEHPEYFDVNDKQIDYETLNKLQYGLVIDDPDYEKYPHLSKEADKSRFFLMYLILEILLLFRQFMIWFHENSTDYTREKESSKFGDVFYLYYWKYIPYAVFVVNIFAYWILKKDYFDRERVGYNLETNKYYWRIKVDTKREYKGRTWSGREKYLYQDFYENRTEVKTHKNWYYRKELVTCKTKLKIVTFAIILSVITSLWITTEYVYLLFLFFTNDYEQFIGMNVMFLLYCLAFETWFIFSSFRIVFKGKTLCNTFVGILIVGLLLRVLDVLLRLGVIFIIKKMK